MVRTQIQLTEEQARRLREATAAERISIRNSNGGLWRLWGASRQASRTWL